MQHTGGSSRSQRIFKCCTDEDKVLIMVTLVTLPNHKFKDCLEAKRQQTEGIAAAQIVACDEIC